MKQFDPKRPAEEVTLTFDFSGECPSPRTITASSVTVARQSGAGSETAAMLVGSAVAQSTSILQRIAGGNNGTRYVFVAQVTRDDGEIRELAGVLQVSLL